MDSFIYMNNIINIYLFITTIIIKFHIYKNNFFFFLRKNKIIFLLNFTMHMLVIISEVLFLTI